MINGKLSTKDYTVSYALAAQALQKVAELHIHPEAIFGGK